MKLGISINSAYLVEDVRAGARHMLERASAASAAGLDSLFLGDHHATPVPYYQNVPMLGRMLAEWRGEITGTLHLLPLWHPLLLAEQVATLACLAPGRFVLQCAIGPDDEQFPAFGLSARERRPRFEQTLALLRRLWAGEQVDGEPPCPLRGARCRPIPPEPVEVWIGAVAPAAIDRAARLGDAWLAAPALTPELAGRHLEQYRERCAAHGREPHAVIRRDVYVGRSAEEARATAGAIVAAGHRGFPAEAPVVGDVEAVAAAFQGLAEQGYEHVLVRNLVPDQAQALGCIERLAAVRERLRD